MARRPCRRSEPSSSDAEEVSVFDRYRQGSVTTVDRDMEPQDLDDMLMIHYSTYTYWREYI